MPETITAPTPTMVTLPPASEPAIWHLTLPEGDAWNLVKRTVGAEVVVLRPTWLPARFRSENAMIEYAYTDHPRLRVGYASDDGLILVAVGAVNSASPNQSLAIEIGDVTATYSATSSWPERQVHWIETGVLYSIQARGVTQDELIRVARSLVEVSVVDAGANPRPVTAPLLPSTSTAPEPGPQWRLR